MERFTRDESSGSVLSQDFHLLQNRRAAKRTIKAQKERILTLEERITLLEERMKKLEEKLS